MMLTVRKAAALLDMHPETLRRAIRAGKLACYKPGRCARITETQLQAYLDAHLCPARDQTDPASNGESSDGTSSAGMQTSVAAFQLGRRKNAALDRHLPILKPDLKVVL